MLAGTMTILKHVFSMATVSLIVLVIQNSLLVVMTRFSRKNVSAPLNYYTSTLVLNQECMKMLMCLVIYAFDDVWKQVRRESSAVTTTTTGTVKVATTEETVGDDAAALQVDGNSFARLKATGEKKFSPTPRSDAAQAKEEAPEGRRNVAKDRPVAVVVGEEEASAAKLSGPPSVMRYSGSVVTPPSSAAVSGTTTSTTTTTTHESAKPTDIFAPRKNKLRFAWVRAQAVANLYCSMLRVAVVKRDTFKLLLPAFLFNLQNFLLFVGLSNLDAVSFQVWSQTKLLSTALFSVWLLHRKLSLMQWLSLVLLTMGVLGAQIGSTKSGSLSVSANITITSDAPTTLSKAPRQQLQQQRRLMRVVPMLGADDEPVVIGGDEEPQANALVGIAACVISGLSSSYAGVYFEKVVKTTSPTLSIRNIQLSLFGIPFAFVSMLLLDVFPRWHAQYQCGDPVNWNIFRNPLDTTATGPYDDNGGCPVRPFYFWQHYDNLLTWGLVGIHALGGLLVAIVVKYADNILKGFATGVAVIVSGMMSSAIWGYKPSLAFVLGAMLVIGSSIMFHKFEPKG